MKQKQLMLIIFSCLFTAAILLAGISYASEYRVSSPVLEGYRILNVQLDKGIQKFTVYRGDYIKFRLPKEISDPIALFPTLKQSRPLTHDLETTAYFKMKQTGIYLFNIGSIHGQIRVIEYRQANYRKLSAREADEFIKLHSPIILDVRTRREYKRGHLENSILIPVQVLQKRIRELNYPKDGAIMVYCATGNRSTVASKILIDAGFTDVFNLEHGIVDWVKKHYPVVR